MVDTRTISLEDRRTILKKVKEGLSWLSFGFGVSMFCLPSTWIVATLAWSVLSSIFSPGLLHIQLRPALPMASYAGLTSTLLCFLLCAMQEPSWEEGDTLSPTTARFIGSLSTLPAIWLAMMVVCFFHHYPAPQDLWVAWSILFTAMTSCLFIRILMNKSD